ncbi:MAG TPA: hypothetical protein DGD08_11680 [Gemmatimonas aurantiaca]|uniref:Caspase family protein n=2 Tax=Gemmatimonas aurantiaca TaxID=173480 RepID=C1ACB3_GEMAT|nr:hypothetical protein [Gemmatimonas aurantiaca]BAH40140.1 hypothetical protein GAU_3098 [Gemmatimonas aurantiaca T-27]HCT57852.1 hypothetical protein [Gemmatimonas aurantiaca]
MRHASRLWLACAAAITLSLPASVVHAQRTHVLIVAGLSGAPNFKTAFNQAIASTRTAARERWAVADSNFVALTEDSLPTAASQGQSTKANIAAAFLRLSKRVSAGDVVLVMLFGHGSGEGPGSKVNLPGPDATASEYASWMAPFTQQQVVFVNAATGSGDFVPVLAKSGRVVITATRTAMERNESEFLGVFTKALNSEEADADKDGRLSVLEAFRYARAEVAKSYERTNRMLTEHAVLSDSIIAGRITFGGKAVSANPRVAALIAERQILESQVAALRTRKATMAADAYDAELERLLLAIAEKTQAIKAAGGDK